MKILLTNYDLSLWAGSETWTMTMFNYLSQRHFVDIYVSSNGENKLIDVGYDENGHYDLAIINHNICLNEIKGWDIDTRIFTSHGIVPRLERPIFGADIYVAVSEEVQAVMKRKWFDAEVIRNPINIDVFKPSPINKELKNILIFHARNVLGTLREASRGYNLRVLTGWKPDVITDLAWADLVISSGRGCYEALSCGKNVLVAGVEQGIYACDGMVTPGSIFELRKNNCSGRRYGFKWTVKSLRGEFEKYDPERNMRPYILEHNNINIIAEQYLKLKEIGA